MSTISEALAIAAQHHQAGRLQAAEQICRQILQADPNQADASHLLGVIASQRGQPAMAVEYIGRAIRLNGNVAAFHNNLGVAFRDQGKLDEAIACYRRALELNPDFALAHNNLGVALGDQKRPEEAAQCLRRALELKPDLAEAHYNLGGVLKDMRQWAQAAASYRCALELNPNYAEAHNNLGNTLMAQASPEAVACFRRALELKPEDAETHYNLGNALKEQWNLGEAVVCYRRALQLKPDFAEAHNNLGGALRSQGKLDESLACYRRALELKPDYAEAHSNLVYTQIYCPGCDAQTLLAAHRDWNQRHAAPLAKFIQPHRNDRSPNRRLRVGYISPDFRNHCQALFTVPLLAVHDHQTFEIFCYADVANPDDLTRRLRGYADAWREIAGRTDAQIAELIRQDQIDILVDLTMHMSRNHLLVFARKPAPLQVCWMAYPGTTGLSTIDYRLTDPYLDPPGLNDDCYCEESVRLPDSFWCYDPLHHELPVSSLPAAENGYITFGCLNNFCKVNPEVLRLWARVLKVVERSRLTLLTGEGEHRRQTLDLLAAEGAGGDRVTFVAHQPRQHYLQYYHDIDIGLDTVPYNGHTTSLDSF